jgi:hypothetical protein
LNESVVLVVVLEVAVVAVWKGEKKAAGIVR